MNGIIHPCSHPEDKPPPESEEEMYKNIMDYVDRYIRGTFLVEAFLTVVYSNHVASYLFLETDIFCIAAIFCLHNTDQWNCTLIPFW